MMQLARAAGKVEGQIRKRVAGCAFDSATRVPTHYIRCRSATNGTRAILMAVEVWRSRCGGGGSVIAWDGGESIILMMRIV